MVKEWRSITGVTCPRKGAVMNINSSEDVWMEEGGAHAVRRGGLGLQVYGMLAKKWHESVRSTE